jgi:F-type H+-transporting ATPase subunit a
MLKVRRKLKPTKMNWFFINQNRPLDFSITVNVLYLFIAAGLMLLIFLTIARRYKRNPYAAPRGIQSLLEPVLVFVRDDVAKSYIGEDQYKKYLPLLYNFFFFIWILNLLGLTPFAANVTGNISVTLTLALTTLVVLIVSATRDYWKHIFWMPGVPAPLKVIMMVVEIIGVIAKPFGLTIRLFAVITAGHVIIVSLVALIFVMGDMGTNPLAGFLISPVSVLFMLFIHLLELFVGTLQAYVFTLLSAVFIGQALESHDHHEEVEEQQNEVKHATA